MQRAKIRLPLFVLSLLISGSNVTVRADVVPQPYGLPVPQILPELTVKYTGPCKTYLLRDGEDALLFDLGGGKLMESLPSPDLGIDRVEWILFTHHHREQCQGIGIVDRSQSKVAAPKAEAELFETPRKFRKWYPKLGDKYSVYGASYARPPAQPIPLDRQLEDGEIFEWHDYQIQCLLTPGHSPGSMSYLIEKNGKTVALTGDLMYDGSRMVTWFDSEWDYGFGKGIDTLIGSVEKLLEHEPDVMLPSHGPTIEDAQAQLKTYLEKLKVFRASYIRGYPVFDSTPEQRDSYSKPTVLPLINQVTPHLYKLSHETKGKNFAIIISDNGHGLILDAGLFPKEMLEEIIVGLRKHMGLKQIDAFWISHMHGDHFLLGPELKRKYGAEAWTLDIIADKCENPRRYDYSALVSAYGNGFDGMKIEKTFTNGETVEWEGYTIQVDWMPGQTEFGCCLWLELDGKRIAFTGDNLFGTASDPEQNGHEAVVARNSSIIEEGYLLGSAYLKALDPDIVMGSHSYVMDDPAGFLSRYHDWAQEIIRLYKDLLPDEDYEYLYDPYWVSAYPYRVDLTEADERTVEVTVRNFRGVPQQHDIELKLPPGVSAEPQRLHGWVKPEGERVYEVRLTVDREKVPPGVQMVPFDIRLDNRWHGKLFDFLILAEPDEASTLER